MLDVRSTASSFVALVPAPVVKPSDFLTLSYAPALLLDVRFPIVVIADAVFSDACEVGFDAYFDEMMSGSTFEDSYLEDHFYTWDEVERVLCENMSSAYGDSLPWRAGFCLGWLSALALTDRPLALRGAELLCLLVASEHRALSAGSVA